MIFDQTKMIFLIFFSQYLWKSDIQLFFLNFFQADPSFSEAVVGMNPDKEKHQFFIDVVPEFGFPLAIRSAAKTGFC